MKGVQPMGHAEKIFEVVVGQDVLDPHRNDRAVEMDRALHLALDLGRGVGMAGENQHHHGRIPDRVHDGAPQLEPGRMSRGAIQQRIPSCSRRVQMRSTNSLSFDEWLRKTSWAMGSNLSCNFRAGQSSRLKG
ncbi:MAG: hypothetical protein WDO13_15440 [Verrucomicrobiota bacterium]